MYTVLKEELVRTWQMKTTYIMAIVLSTADTIPDRLHEGLKLLNLPSGLYILMQKAITLKYTPHSQNVFGRTVNKMCLVSEIRTVLRTS